MSTPHDETILTAYVLGELEGAERERVAAWLATDEEARARADMIQSTADAVTAALRSESRDASAAPAALDPVRRSAILEERAPRPRRVGKGFWATAAAAVVVVGCGLTVLQTNVGPLLGWLNQVKSSTGHDSATRTSFDGEPVTVADLLLGRGAAEAWPSGAVGQPGPVVAATAQMMAAQLPPATAGQADEFSAGAADALVVPPGEEGLLAEGDSPPDEPWNTERYAHVVDNAFQSTLDEPLSTFSIDVDTGSYSNVRRYLDMAGQLPPPGAVRIEELLNYFSYDYPPPAADDPAPFAASSEVGPAPWKPEHRLVRIGLKGREVAAVDRPAANLVFLIDVSGSMEAQSKLDLVKQGLARLTEQLRADDRVAVVVYAGASGLVLPATPGDQTGQIQAAIQRLQSGGSTNGGQGIQLAYDTARAALIPGGVNRVVLATDGDFNVGVTSMDALLRLIEDEARSGVFLSVLGFGMGNYNDQMLEQLADRGNGNYAYIDRLAEAEKVLVEQLAGTLVTIAKDVKIQVEFNPARVAYYRLIGYENRVLAAQDFNDDTKDAGEIGAGHTVTALYEVVPPGVPLDVADVDPLRYQGTRPTAEAAGSDELLTLKLRYKEPDGDTSRLLSFVVPDTGADLASTSDDFRFAAAVAAFGMLLRESPHSGDATMAQVVEMADGARGADASGYRQEFVELARRADGLTR